MIVLGNSSVRRIVKRGGGGQELQKLEKIKDLNQKFFDPKSVRFFAQNLVKTKKKRSLKFSPVFRPKLGERAKKNFSLKFSPIFRPNVRASLKLTHKTYPLCDQTFCPTCKGGAMPQFCRLFFAIIRSWRPGVPKPGGNISPNNLTVFPPNNLRMVYICISSDNLTLVCI